LSDCKNFKAGLQRMKSVSRKLWDCIKCFYTTLFIASQLKCLCHTEDVGGFAPHSPASRRAKESPTRRFIS
jgi:hypothetical protein